MGRYLVLCTIDQRARDRVAPIRDRHVAHVLDHLEHIAYGGVVGADDGPPEAICYFLDVSSEAEARAFVDADPYTDFYASVRIEPFGQRLPGPLATGRTP